MPLDLHHYKSIRVCAIFIFFLRQISQEMWHESIKVQLISNKYAVIGGASADPGLSRWRVDDAVASFCC